MRETVCVGPCERDCVCEPMSVFCCEFACMRLVQHVVLAQVHVLSIHILYMYKCKVVGGFSHRALCTVCIGSVYCLYWLCVLFVLALCTCTARS